MKTGAIVQARMGSTRLPGKVLKDVGEYTLLTYLVERIRLSEHLDQIVVATSGRDENNVIEEKCREQGIDCYRGKEEDLLDRYYQAANQFGIERIVRITADCPLVDPRLIDRMLEEHTGKVDYLTNNRPRTFPHGLDIGILRREAIETIWNETDSFDGRHVTGPLVQQSTFNDQERFTAENIGYDVDFSHLRITVDYPEDLDVVRFLIDQTSVDASWHQYLAVLTKHPEYIERNRQYVEH